MIKLSDYDIIKKSVKNDAQIALGVMQMAALTGCSWQEVVTSMGYKPADTADQEINIGEYIGRTDLEQLKNGRGTFQIYDKPACHAEEIAIFIGSQNPLYPAVKKMMERKERYEQ